MGASFKPIYKHIFSKRNLLVEKLKSDYYKTWECYAILEFGSSQFLVQTDFFKTPIHPNIKAYNTGYFSIKIIVEENVGKSSGKDFLDWIDSFYDKKNNYYRFNIYDSNSKDIALYTISKSMKKIKKFNAISCVVKNPIFFNSKRSKAQIGITITSCNVREVGL